MDYYHYSNYIYYSLMLQQLNVQRSHEKVRSSEKVRAGQPIKQRSTEADCRVVDLQLAARYIDKTALRRAAD